MIRKEQTMDNDANTNGDEQRTQVGPDPLDYVLRYAAGDYDCYHQGRYIGSRATLPKAIEAVEHEQAKAARHLQLSPAANNTLDVECDELRAIAARVYEFTSRLVTCPVEHPQMRAQLMLAHIRASAALRSLQDAERSLRLARCAADLVTPLDTAA